MSSLCDRAPPCLRRFVNPTILGKSNDQEKQYRPRELHFPSVGDELDWPALPILDWADLEASAPEYTFLKELGVREVPELNSLLTYIIKTHPTSSVPVRKYHVSDGLTYLATHFHQHYFKFWNAESNKRAFLPCYDSTKMFERDYDDANLPVLLASPDSVFAGLCSRQS